MLHKRFLLQPFQPIGYPCRALEMSATRPTSHVETCVDPNVDCSSYSRSNYRSTDGRCNNVVNPRWGSAGSRFGRMARKSKNKSICNYLFQNIYFF